MAVVVVNHVTLDGVMQGPGRADEDTRDGFEQGGWAVSVQDPALSQAMASVMGSDFAWLFGRRSYDDMLQHWNTAGGPFKDGLNGAAKYVASSNPAADLPWPNSTLLTGDVPAAVASLREEREGNLVIMGSGQLIRTLLPHGLIDELLLMVHPVTLGSGRTLFPDDGERRNYTLVSAEATREGVLITRYRPAK
jgi:dihydrofolate reductase